MFRFTIRDVLGMILPGAAVAAIFAGILAFLSWQNSSRSNVGNIRQGLEHISKETDRRESEIGELTGK
jgi:hypothetical protein